MSAHDMIELPPLPPLHIVPSVEPVDYPEVAQALMDYARAAIEADRKRRGEPVAYAVFANNGNIRIWCADPAQVETLRQQYGEALQPLYAAPPTPTTPARSRNHE